MRFATFLLVLEDYMLPCFTKKIFGFDCPGCGLQRSVLFLLRGDLQAAWDMYPAIFTMIPLFGFILADSFLKIKYSNFITISLVIMTVILILGNYILKFI